MTDTTAPLAAGETAVPATEPGQLTPRPETYSDPSEAARFLANRRVELSRKAKETPAAPQQVSLQALELAPADNEPAAAQPQESEDGSQGEPVPADETEAPEPAEQPPLDPPRSWSAEAKERFQALPRDVQEVIRDNERERDRKWSIQTQEAAEQRKAVEAQQQAVAQAKAQYEQALPQLLQTLQGAVAGEFADIKSHDDALRLSKEDPFRYATYMARQQQLAAINAEAQAANHRQQTEQQQKWNEYAAKQDKAFVEAVPEAAKPESLSKLQKSALDYLTDIGFSREEIIALYNGSVVRDARIQRAILDGARYREAQKALKTTSPKPVPPVQKPGTAQPRQDSRLAQYEALGRQLETATGTNAVRIAAERRVLAKQAAAKR